MVALALRMVIPPPIVFDSFLILLQWYPNLHNIQPSNFSSPSSDGCREMYYAV